MRIIPIKKIILEDGGIINDAPESPWPPANAMLVTSDENNYTVYVDGDTLPAEPPPPTPSPDPTIEEKMQILIDFAEQLGIPLSRP